MWRKRGQINETSFHNLFAIIINQEKKTELSRTMILIVQNCMREFSRFKIARAHIGHTLFLKCRIYFQGKKVVYRCIVHHHSGAWASVVNVGTLSLVYNVGGCQTTSKLF